MTGLTRQRVYGYYSCCNGRVERSTLIQVDRVGRQILREIRRVQGWPGHLHGYVNLI